MSKKPRSLIQKAFHALLLLLALAAAARIIWELLKPVLPSLIALAVVCAIVLVFFQRH